MKAVVALLSSRWTLGTLAVLLLAVLIWFAGPYFAFAEVRPFASAIGRLIGILVLIVAWALVLLVQQLREARANRALGDSAVGASAKGDGGARTAEEATLRERFDEAVATLRRGKGRRRTSLYALPWYIVIGPPGAGKTTMLVNSGLEFPLAETFGRQPVQGVGGTRNCDWWFTDQAVLLDTAGRYTTQDSDRDADARGWRSFLGLLARVRKRRPINGVIIAISVQDLLTQSEQERLEHVRAIRHRLAELGRELGISFPVYLLVTKCDLVSGFAEFFDDLDRPGREQVWGVTFPFDASRSGEAAALLGSEFDRLLDGLDGRMLERVADERDLRRRARIFAFPQQVVGLKPRVVGFVQAIFASPPAERPIWLRGVYLTSATQEGTPIDRLVASVSRTFGVPAAATSPAAGQGKAYFIERLLKEVVFEEAGLAGVNRRAELMRHGFQLAAYLMVAIGVVGLLVAMAWSYRANISYLQQVAEAAEPLASLPRESDADLMARLPRLDRLNAIVNVAAQNEPGPPRRMRWGLYQGRGMIEAARDAYLRELNAALGPPVGRMLERRLVGASGSPEALYETLKSYLMLGEPRRLEPALVAGTVLPEWQRSFQGSPALVETLAMHTAAWLETPARVRAITINPDLVERARISLAQASVPVLMYSRLKSETAGQQGDAIRLDRELGLGAERVLFRRSGAPLGQPFPALYTRAAFDAFDRSGKLSLVRSFLDDAWVLGDRAPAVTQTASLGVEVQQLYERDYIRAWRELLEDVRLQPVGTLDEARERLTILSGPSSPLKALVMLVDAQTNFAKPPPGSDGALAAQAESRLGALTGMAQGPRPGAAVTAAFAEFHKLAEGPPGAAPIDQLLQGLARLSDRLVPTGGAAAGTALAQVERELAIIAAQLPGPLATAVSELGSQTTASAASVARGELGGKYRAEVVSACRELLGRRYPFNRASGEDVALGDFGTLFERGGIYDAFFQENLAPLVDTSRSPWRWRDQARAVGAGAVDLGQFQLVDRIRQEFFPAGSGGPTFAFTLTPDYLDAQSLRFTLEVDGQQLDYRHGPPRSIAMSWPASAAGQATVVFEAADGGRPNVSHRGPWAWFRLLDAAQVRPLSPTRFELTFKAGGREARVILDAASARNPLVNREYQRFSCG